MFTVSLTEYAPIAVYFLALERFVTAKKSSQESALQGPSCTYRPGLAVLVFIFTKHHLTSKYFSPQLVTQIALSIVYLDIAYSSLLFNLRIRLALNADIINTLEFSTLVLTWVWLERKNKNSRGQLASLSTTNIYLPRAICITRSFSSWLSFNMVVRTGTKCSLSFGRHFRNCNMTFLRYSRFACSFSRSWFLSSLKKYIHDSRFSFQEPWLLLNCANKVDYMANEGRENEVNNFPVNV